MASERLVGALLAVLAASKPSGNMLELGTGTGLSTAWLLHGMDADSRLATVDVDAALQQIAASELGSDGRVRFVNQDALQFLKEQPSAHFDLVFADAMPGKYDGLDLALGIVKPGGFYVVDDMLPQPNWPDGHASRVSWLLNTLASNHEWQVAPIAWASGAVVAVRR